MSQISLAMQTAKWMEIPVLVALIAGLGSLVVSCLTAFFSYRAKIKESQLTDQNAERKARRDYEYEARKRLYEQCEPLLFELYELSIGGMKRVGSLARSAREGYLTEGTRGWLAVDAYYTLSTVYKLTAPLAIVKIIQRRLTLVDLALDARIREQFSLANCLYLTFSADFKLAGAIPELQYEPNLEFDPECMDFSEKCKSEPEKYCRQGLPVGRLDTAIEALIMSDEKGASRCMTFGEFESRYMVTSSDLHRNFSEVVSLFLHFHPRTRPILWRMLITQSHLYKTIVLNSETNFKWKKSGKNYAQIPEDERKKRYDWRQSPDEATDAKVLVEPFDVAEKYLTKRLGRIFSEE
jgi:hypothetical protein